MTDTAKDLDLSVLPPEYRAVFEAQAARVVLLEEVNKRQEHLIAEMRRALYGKKSEKLRDDDRQLAFEDIEVALAEVEEQRSDQAPSDKPKRKKIAKRNRGNLPEGLPRIEQVIEPDSLECPCGCGAMHRIGEDRNERVDIVPAQLRVTTAAAMVHELVEAVDERRLQRLQKTLASQDLLIIDKLGFVPLSKMGAELLFEIISQRYERGSIIITSNLPFDEWTEVFGSERLTGAILDRLTHHVHILEMNGESFRLRQSRKTKA